MCVFVCSWICDKSAFSWMTYKFTPVYTKSVDLSFSDMPLRPRQFQPFYLTRLASLTRHHCRISINIRQQAAAHNTVERHTAAVHSALSNCHQIVDSSSSAAWIPLPDLLVLWRQREFSLKNNKPQWRGSFFIPHSVWFDYVIHHGITIKRRGTDCWGAGR